MTPSRLAIVAALLLIILHPFADIGTDEDDAIEIGWSAMLRGESPYSHRTQLGNPLTPTLGGLAICAPGCIQAHCLGILAIFILSSANWGTICLITILLSLKSLVQGIDYLYCSSVLCLVLRCLHDHATGRCGRLS